MNNWLHTRLTRLPDATRLKIMKSIVTSMRKTNDLSIHPLEKPEQPKDYSVWFHLMIDIYEASNLDKHDVIKDFFVDLIKSTGMKPLTDIIIKTVDNKQGHGTSAIQMISTSSITYHADDKYNNAFLDFFSCKSFDPKQVIALVEKYFEPRKIDPKFIYRRET